jgi:hypothetical protein
MTRARQEYEGWLRTSTDGFRDFAKTDNEAEGALGDPYGRIIVAPSTLGGFDVPASSNTPVPVRRFWVGSAPQYDNLGLVESAKVLDRPSLTVDTNNAIFCIRMFGYVTAVGWVQLILKDESGGPNPPVLADVPEVTIAVGADQNFVFGNWPLATTGAPGIGDLATYIAFSTTGPTYTPGGANMWFAHLGAV